MGRIVGRRYTREGAKTSPDLRQKLLDWFEINTGHTWKAAKGPHWARLLGPEGHEANAQFRREVAANERMLERMLKATSELEEWQRAHASDLDAFWLVDLARKTTPWLTRYRLAHAQGVVLPSVSPERRAVDFLDRNVFAWPFGRRMTDLEMAHVLLLLGWWPRWTAKEPDEVVEKTLGQIVDVQRRMVKRARGESSDAGRRRRATK